MNDSSLPSLPFDHIEGICREEQQLPKNGQNKKQPKKKKKESMCHGPGIVGNRRCDSVKIPTDFARIVRRETFIP